jgi:hypothetical protein
MKTNYCRLIEKKLIFYIDNELDEKESGLVMAHISECTDCQFLFRELSDGLKLLDEDKLTDSNPFFITRVMEKMKNESQNEATWNWIPKRKLALQFAIYIILGIFAIITGFYLGSGNNVVDEITFDEQIDTTDYQYFANSYSTNFDKNAYSIDFEKVEE